MRPQHYDRHRPRLVSGLALAGRRSPVLNLFLYMIENIDLIGSGTSRPDRSIL